MPYTNNVKGPRMKKGRFSSSVITKDLFKRFKQKHPEHQIDWKTFSEKWEEIAGIIRDEVVNNPLGVKLGFYAGELKLQYLPYKFEAKDQASGDKHINLTTRGKVGKLKWERRWAVKFNKMLQFYAFDATRKLTKMAKEKILDSPEAPRVSRNTLGGYSAWRQLKNQYGKSSN
jgi:hypothetical protein